MDHNNLDFEPKEQHPFNIASLLGTPPFQQELPMTVPLDWNGFQHNINVTSQVPSVFPNYNNTLSSNSSYPFSMIHPTNSYQPTWLSPVTSNKAPKVHIAATLPATDLSLGSLLEPVVSSNRSPDGIFLESSITPITVRLGRDPKPTPLQAIRALPIPKNLKEINSAKDHLGALIHIYSISPYLDQTESEALATKLSLTVAQVRNWFTRARTQDRYRGKKPNGRPVRLRLLTDEQVADLTSELDMSKEISKERIGQLAERLGLPERQVEEWMETEMVRRNF